MNWWGSGFIPIIIYASFNDAHIDDFAIETESNLNILTESNLLLLTEGA